MALKSYSSFKKKTPIKKTKGIIKGSITALLGIALISQTANAVRRI